MRICPRESVRLPPIQEIGVEANLAMMRREWILSIVQSWAKKWAPGYVNVVPAIAYCFGLK